MKIIPIFPYDKGFFTIVDDEDYIILKNIRWYLFNNNGKLYAEGMVDSKKVRIHSFIVNPPKGSQVDHKDGNGLNNCKSNLRACTQQQNNFNRKKYKINTTGFKGVYRNHNRFVARINANKKQINLGNYVTAQEAAIAYDEGCILYHGDFALTNRMMGLLV
jgi:hypothetical protein